MATTSLFFVRHGQRIDHTDPSWALSSPTPQDPPLTALGQQQSHSTGAALAALLGHQDRPSSAAESSMSTPPESPEAGQDHHHLFPLPPRPQHVAIVASPFLRCTQTAVELAKGLRSHTKDCHITLAVEPGIAEWLSFEYVPAPVSDSMIVQRMQELAMTRRENEQYYSVDWKYRAHTISLPPWPETREAMQSRIETTYRHVLSTYFSTSIPADKDVSIVFVSHASPINALLEACLQTPTLVPIPLGSISQCRWISDQDYQTQEQTCSFTNALASPPLGSILSTRSSSPSLKTMPAASPIVTQGGQDGRWLLESLGSVTHLS